MSAGFKHSSLPCDSPCRHQNLPDPSIYRYNIEFVTVDLLPWSKGKPEISGWIE
jgi:hypothetical protein